MQTLIRLALIGAGGVLLLSAGHFTLAAADSPRKRNPGLALDLPPGTPLSLPTSSSEGLCTETIRIDITRKRILVEYNDVAPVKNGRLDPASMNGHRIIPLTDEMNRQTRRLRKIEKLSGGKYPFMGTVLLLADASTPYRLVVDVLHTAAFAGQSHPSVMTLAAHQPPAQHGAKAPNKRHPVTRCIDVSSPPPPVARATTNPSDPRRTPVPLNLTVAVANSGIFVGAAGEMIRGPDGTLPTLRCTRKLEHGRCPDSAFDAKTGRWSDAQDFRGLVRLATRLKGKHPSERTVIVAAEATTSWQTVIRALDALRGAQGHPLFDRPVLSVGPE